MNTKADPFHLEDDLDEKPAAKEPQAEDLIKEAARIQDADLDARDAAAKKIQGHWRRRGALINRGAMPPVAVDAHGKKGGKKEEGGKKPEKQLTKKQLSREMTANVTKSSGNK